MSDVVDDSQELADFDSGFTGKEQKPAKAAKGKPAEAPQEEPAAEPEYVQINAKDWAEVIAAARKTASYDQQLSKAFGTIGNLQKLVNELQSKGAEAAPQKKKVEISKEAFAEMEKDFPELAHQTRAALEKALSGIPVGDGAEIDATKIEQMLASYTSRREVEILEDAYPDWREIVGAIDATKEQPDPNNPFRKWLATKDAAYQERINGTESAAVIGRAIQLFQTETKAPRQPAAAPRNEARADRIRAAVQPKGDGGAAAPSKSEEDDFIAGFNSR